MNVPAPVPSEVLVLRATVGFALVLQHTPLAVTVDPPSEVTFPPLVAVDDEVAEVVSVVTVGKVIVGDVVKVSSAPYPVPALLVA